jgi:hypothetical protein
MIFEELLLVLSPPPNSGTVFDIDARSNLASLNGDRGVSGASAVCYIRGASIFYYLFILPSLETE